MCITAADDSEVRSNVDSTGQVAIVVTQPQDYTSVQLKGVASVVRPLGPDDKARVDAHLEKVVEGGVVGPPDVRIMDHLETVTY